MPLRAFGSAPFSALPNEAGSNDPRPYGGASQPNTTDNAVDIDAAGEGGLVGFQIPSQWKRVGHFRWQFAPNINGFVMVRLTVVVYRCGYNGKVWDQIFDIYPNCDAVNDTLICPYRDLSPFAHCSPGDFVFLGATWLPEDAGCQATDIRFLGAKATET